MNWEAFSVFADVPRYLASVLPNKSALVCGAGSVTFAEVNTRMNRFTNGLLKLGVRTGDRIAVLSQNRPEMVEIYGAAKAGIAVMPLNWRLSRRELLPVMTNGEPLAVLAEPVFAPVVDDLRPHIPSLRHFIEFGPRRERWTAYETLLAQSPVTEPDLPVQPDDVLCVMYTSGTTGQPKGAMLTHGGLLRNARAAAEWMLELEETDVALAAMPLFHVGGMWYHLFPSFARGCTAVLMPEFSPAGVLALIAKHGVTYAHLVPTMINALINHPAVAHTDLSRLRLIYYAASSIPVNLLRKAMSTFPHCSFVQGYGSTEAGMITALTAENHRESLADPKRAGRLSTCGRPLRCEVRIHNPDKHGIGEIAVRSDRMMAGYWRHPMETEDVMGDGWLRTGDLGLIDDEGYVTVADRKHDMIVSGGENVYPREVEDALCQDPAILEVAVFGVPDPHWVERVAAAVVLKPGVAATAEELRHRARARLAGYKCPKTIILCGQLPKSGAGKILKNELRRLYAVDS